MIRTFLAVELPSPLHAQFADVQQQVKQRLGRDLSRAVRLSWVQPGSMHLTVKFLGDIDEQSVQPMQEALAHALTGHRPIQIPLDRLGTFPRPQQPRVLWVGPPELWEKGDEAARLAALHRAVEDCCVSLNLAPDSRPLSPHLTLARISEGEREFGQALARSGVMDKPVAIGSLAVESIALMKSELRPTGAVYTKLWEVKLRGAGHGV